MPRYEYRCKACGFTFELRRPMSQSADPAPCPRGHADTVKLLSTVSVGVGSSSSGSAAPASGPAPSAGGGCCGGGCCS